MPLHADTEVLDHAAWSSLTTTHAAVARRTGDAARFPADVSPIAAVADRSDPAAWDDLHTLTPSGTTTVVFGPAPWGDVPPPGWEIVTEIPGLQMLAGPAFGSSVLAGSVPLGDDDAADMLSLATATEPGPFAARTHTTGAYHGVRRDGRLVAMAGERLHPAGWVEISAVCTDPSVRGQGLATALMQTVVHGVRARGDRAFLHVAGTNVGAVRLYQALGFTVHRPQWFTVLTPRR